MTKILVIEDEFGIREEVVEWLLAEGYEVYEAADGETGLDLAYECQPDIILCDILMPRMNGLEVLATLRADPHMFDIPFVFVTAAAERESIRQGMQLGADDYITKPFTYTELIDAVSARINRHDQQLYASQRRIENVQEALNKEIEHRMLKSRVMAMFSHDFRNPLTLILSSSNLIINYYDRIDKAEQIKKLKQINGSVHLLMQMLEEMLLLAEMELKNYQTQLETVNISRYIHQIIDEFSEIYTKHHLKFATNTQEIVLTDKKLLRQILHNLLSNAIKYSSEGSDVHVTLNVTSDNIIIEVQDHGVGMPADYLPKLFKPFERANNVNSVKGTGLGLAIVKQAVDCFGGEVHVESQIDEGTTFVVTIPLHT